MQPRKIIACGSCTGARKKRRRRVAAARKEPKSRVSSPSRDSFMTTTTTTSCKCKCSCNINMQPDDDVVVAAAAAEMQMHSTSLLLQLLPQQQQQQQSRLQQKQQQVNCTIFNAKVKSGNGKKSLAKFYAGSCHYLLARLENCGTTSPPSRRPGSTLAAGTSDQLHCCHSEECLVAASFWHMQMPPARAQRPMGQEKRIRIRVRTRTRQLFPFVKCLPDWQEIATVDIDGSEFVVALNVSCSRLMHVS